MLSSPAAASCPLPGTGSHGLRFSRASRHALLGVRETCCLTVTLVCRSLTLRDVEHLSPLVGRLWIFFGGTSVQIQILGPFLHSLRVCCGNWLYVPNIQPTSRM